MVPRYCEVSPQYCLGWYIEMDIVGLAKGALSSSATCQHYTTYRRGVVYTGHLVVDNWWHMLSIWGEPKRAPHK